MQKKIDQHVFQGMQRDMSISKQKAEFLWDANNIRLTSRHGDTLFSMANERGTKRIDNIVFDGVVLGYCVLGNYLTVFTTNGSDSSKPDHIYTVDKTEDGFNLNELYNGNLGFNVNKPIECLGVYENVDIQKVYWTDGENQPRFINIMNRHTDYTETSFDFIPTLALKDSISVRKVADSSGIFAAGVIQYAVTYYNKYGQESNISVVSPLIATSYTSRAGSPEDTIGNAFKVTISNLDMQFEYVRLYSIFRSSKDTTPVCKRVADVKLGSGSGTKVTSKELYISNDRKGIRWCQWGIYGNVDDNSAFQIDPDSNFITFESLPADSPYKGTETVTVNGITFNAGRYYYFSKKDYPQLIIKAWLYHDNQLGDKPTFLTWNTNTTGVYLTLGTVEDFGNQAIIWCTGSGVDSDMISASDMHYELAWTIDGSEITITDNGTIGEEIDYNELLFVGGEEITAGTITQKDGTMFLGDIAIKRPQIKGTYTVNTDVEEYECKATGTKLIGTITNGTSISKSHRTCYFPLTMNTTSYKWGNTLNACSDTAGKNSTNIAGFKWGEHYRLGLQFQYKTGKWSQPVFIGDMKMDNVNQRPSLVTDNGQCVQNVPSFLATLNKTAGDEMLANDYKRVRAVVCFPTESDQLILCQGLLNPTVHSIAGRLNHTPDVQSSWFFRPIPAGNETNDEGGGTLQYLNKHTLWGGYLQATGNDRIIPSRNDEIQGIPQEFSGIPISDYFNDDYSLKPGESLPEININTQRENQKAELKLGYSEDADHTRHALYDTRDLSNIFVVDWNYLTFHSPEFEFNDSFHNMDATTILCRTVGKHLLAYNQGDIHIISQSSPISTDAPGFYHRTVFSSRSASRINAGLFYKDSIVKLTDNRDSYDVTKGNNDNETADISSFLIYPWHRTGSLNNDCARPDGMGSRTAVLSQKKMTNLMYFGTMHSDVPAQLTDATIKVFDSDQVSLVKINDMNYFGNVDQVLSPRFKYPIGWSESEQFTAYIGYLPTGDWSRQNVKQKGLILSNDPVYMKYKSTPHAVVYTNTQIPTNIGESFDNKVWPYLYCAEMYREPQDSDFGGTSAMAIHNNLWYPAGPAVQIGCTVDGTATGDGHTEIPYWYGDTYYQRYDCLKTYPFTDEDTNSIIEIGSFMVETRINLDGRYDKSRGDISNFMLNPTNFNLINPVYSQKDNFFNYRILDDDYYALSNYPTMVTWTGYKNNAAEVDSWTNITLASTLEMDGTKGKVNAIRVNSDQLYCFQDDAVGQILFNSRVQISPSDGVPIEISNNYKVDGNRYISTSIGCKNKWSIAEGTDGLYFIDNNTEALYQLGGQAQIKPISTPLNMSYWFMNQDCGTPWQHYYYDNRVFQQKGIRCFYDSANADLYICTPETTLCYSEKLGQFVSFFDYHHPVGMFNIDSEFYALNYPDDETSTDVKLWGMFQGQYNTFFDKTYQTDFTFISNENPLNDKIFTNIELRGDFRWWERNEIKDDFNSSSHLVDHRRMFDTMRVWNEYQDTGDIDLTFKQDVPSNMKKKFRIWRMNIPRDKNHVRQRIRNTWAKVKLTMNSDSHITLQDLYHTVTPEFVVWNSNSSSWDSLNFTDRIIDGIQYFFEYISDVNGDYIRQYYKNDSGTDVTYATYALIGNTVYRTYPRTPEHGRPIPESYAYRKIHDMEIHDIGVVYYL